MAIQTNDHNCFFVREGDSELSIQVPVYKHILQISESAMQFKAGAGRDNSREDKDPLAHETCFAI